MVPSYVCEKEHILLVVFFYFWIIKKTDKDREPSSLCKL